MQVVGYIHNNYCYRRKYICQIRKRSSRLCCSYWKKSFEKNTIATRPCVKQQQGENSGLLKKRLGKKPLSHIYQVPTKNSQLNHLNTTFTSGNFAEPTTLSKISSYRHAQKTDSKLLVIKNVQQLNPGQSDLYCNQSCRFKPSKQ